MELLIPFKGLKRRQELKKRRNIIHKRTVLTIFRIQLKFKEKRNSGGSMDTGLRTKNLAFFNDIPYM